MVIEFSKFLTKLDGYTPPTGVWLDERSGGGRVGTHSGHWRVSLEKLRVTWTGLAS